MRVAILASALCVAGCSLPANPRTEISYGPFGFHLHNSKDVGIKLKKASYDPATKRFDVEDLEFTDDASTVRRANVEQINAYTEQVRATTAMLTQMTESFAKMVPLSRWGAASGPDVAPDLRETVGKIIKDAVADELRRRFAPAAEEKPAPEGGAP